MCHFLEVFQGRPFSAFTRRLWLAFGLFRVYQENSSQYGSTGVILEMLYGSYIDRHFHIGQIANNPLCAGINGLSDYQGPMAYVEFFRELPLKTLLKLQLQFTASRKVILGYIGDCVGVQATNPRGIVQRLRSYFSGSLALFEFNYHGVAVAVQAQQIYDTTKCSFDLPADYQQVRIEDGNVSGQPAFQPFL